MLPTRLTVRSSLTGREVAIIAAVREQDAFLPRLASREEPPTLLQTSLIAMIARPLGSFTGVWRLRHEKHPTWVHFNLGATLARCSESVVPETSQATLDPFSTSPRRGLEAFTNKLPQD
jgi:hypothetical protein